MYADGIPATSALVNGIVIAAAAQRDAAAAKLAYARLEALGLPPSAEAIAALEAAAIEPDLVDTSSESQRHRGSRRRAAMATDIYLSTPRHLDDAATASVEEDSQRRRRASARVARRRARASDTTPGFVRLDSAADLQGTGSWDLAANEPPQESLSDDDDGGSALDPDDEGGSLTLGGANFRGRLPAFLLPKSSAAVRAKRDRRYRSFTEKHRFGATPRFVGVAPGGEGAQVQTRLRAEGVLIPIPRGLRGKPEAEVRASASVIAGVHSSSDEEDDPGLLAVQKQIRASEAGSIVVRSGPAAEDVCVFASEAEAVAACMKGPAGVVGSASAASSAIVGQKLGGSYDRKDVRVRSCFIDPLSNRLSVVACAPPPPCLAGCCCTKLCCSSCSSYRPRCCARGPWCRSRVCVVRG
jgi:hypothetical protein